MLRNSKLFNIASAVRSPIQFFGLNCNHMLPTSCFPVKQISGTEEERCPFPDTLWIRDSGEGPLRLINSWEWCKCHLKIQILLWYFGQFSADQCFTSTHSHKTFTPGRTHCHALMSPCSSWNQPHFENLYLIHRRHSFFFFSPLWFWSQCTVSMKTGRTNLKIWVIQIIRDDKHCYIRGREKCYRITRLRCRFSYCEKDREVWGSHSIHCCWREVIERMCKKKKNNPLKHQRWLQRSVYMNVNCDCLESTEIEKENERLW